MSSQWLDGIVGCSISAILDMQIFTMPTEFTAAKYFSHVVHV